MARDGIDLSELDEFTDRLIQSSKEAKKTQRKFVQQQGNKLKRKTLAQMRLSEVNELTGNYKSHIKRGKVWKREDGAQAIRVYSNAPHAHLIEDGHKQLVNPGKGKGNGHGVIPGRGIGHKPKDGKKDYVEGRKVFLNAYKDMAPEYGRACEEAIDEMIRKI